MSDIPDIVKELTKRYEGLVSKRSNFDSQFSDIQTLVRPDTSEFMGRNVVGERLTDDIYDGTARDANEELASGISSFLINPADRWFDLVIPDRPDLMTTPRVLEWLESTADRMYMVFQREEANFNPATDEALLDVCSFGTGILSFEYDSKLGHPVFQSMPLASTYIEENHRGIVDTLFRRMSKDYRWALERFKQLPPKMSEKAKGNPEKEFDILHAIYPNKDYRSGTVSKKYKSVWICLETKELIKESGIDYFPYATPRWRIRSGESYGRGPAMKCLPDIKMLNNMEYLNIKAGTKQVDPPLVMTEDGFMLPIDTAHGSILWKFPSVEDPKPLRFEGDLPWGEEKAAQKREFIQKCFHIDWLRMEKKNQEMTALEVQDRRQEKLRLLAPTLGRLSNELLGPIIEVTYEMMSMRDYFLPPPPELEGQEVRPEYTGAAAKAQLGTKVVAMDQYIQRLIPLAQARPEVLDAVDLDAYAQLLSVYQGTPRGIINDRQKIKRLRQAREQMQQMQQMAEVAEPASKAIDNLASARQKGGLGI